MIGALCCSASIAADKEKENEEDEEKSPEGSSDDWFFPSVLPFLKIISCSLMNSLSVSESINFMEPFVTSAMSPCTVMCKRGESTDCVWLYV